METLYKNHLIEITTDARTLLAKVGADVLLLHAGSALFYHADDREIPFRTHAHFARFTPVTGPNHVLIIDHSEALPLFLEFRPDDFWEEQIDTAPAFWREYLPHCVVKNTEELKREMISRIQNKKILFVGDEKTRQQFATWHPLVTPTPDFLTPFDFNRALKTPYEISCITEATRIASVGHKKLQEIFRNGATEREMYYTFLESTHSLPHDMPYEPIIAINEKSATLHYRNKRDSEIHGSVLLVDAGVSVHGYASDITRTTVSPQAHPVFTAILNELNVLQQQLCKKVKPSVEFIELHDGAHQGIAHILIQNKVLLCSIDCAIEHGLTRAFFPHGLGHMLGLQVHDVGATSELSEHHPLRKKYPRVRTNRKLETGMVTTIEPGIYFIPMLLNPFRTGEHSSRFNWKLIDELMSCGGMRIEDNLVVTETGSENLTRKYL